MPDKTEQPKLSIVEEKKPDDFILNPILAIHAEIDDLNIEMDKLNKISDGHTRLLSDILNREGDILKQLLDIRDAGGKLTVTGTATATRFFIIDTNADPGHRVKSVLVTNNGPNTLYAGEDAAYSPQVDADLVDIVGNQSRFLPVFVGESERFIYNVRSIKSVHLLADPTVPGATCQFRVRMAW